MDTSASPIILAIVKYSFLWLLAWLLFGVTDYVFGNQSSTDPAVNATIVCGAWILLKLFESVFNRIRFRKTIG